MTRSSSAATALIFARAVFEPVARRAWVSFGCAMAAWCAGTILWSVVYGGVAHPPYPTFADALWLLWYPLMAAGMVFLIRVRFRNFEVHRWMDGIAVMLMVLVVGFGLVVQPLAEEAANSNLATVVDWSYPVLDVLLIGALLGVYGLLGWRPDAMWIFIGLGIVACTCADAAFAVQQAHGVVERGHYDFVWTLGALFVAYAAWVRAPTVHDDDRPVTGHAGHRPGPDRPGHCHRHPDPGHLQGAGEERAGRDGVGARLRLGPDHPDPSPDGHRPRRRLVVSDR